MAFNIKEQWKQINKDTDKVLWIIVILLAIFSILAVFSTSNKLNVAGSSFLFLLSEHIVYVLLGIGLMFVLQKFPPYKAYGIHGRFFLILAIVLLVATLFFGVSEGGSKRSISVLGHKIQTIHMIELCIVIHFSSWLKRVGDGINDIKHVYIPMLLVDSDAKNIGKFDIGIYSGGFVVFISIEIEILFKYYTDSRGGSRIRVECFAVGCCQSQERKCYF